MNAETEEVLSSLSDASTPDEVLVAAVYRASMRLHSQYLPVVRRDLLALDAARYGDRELADRLASVPVEGSESLWRVAWSTGSQVDPRLRFVAEEAIDPHKLAVVVRDGRPLIVTDWDDESVWVSDPITGDVTLEPLADYRNMLNLPPVTTFEIDGRTFAIGHDDDTAWVFDAVTGEQHGEGFTAPLECIHVVATAPVGDEQWVIAGGSDMAGFVCAWAVTPPLAIGKPIRGHTDVVQAVVTTVVDQRPVVVSSGWDASVRLWDQDTGEPIGPPLAGHTDAVVGVCVAAPGIAITGSADGTARVWNLEGGRQVGQVVTTLLEPDVNDPASLDRKLAALGIDTADRALVNAFDPRRRLVRAVAPARIDDVSVALVTGGSKGVAVWDADANDIVWGDLTDDDHHLWSVATVEVEGRPLVASGHSDGGILVRDMADGTPIHDFSTGDYNDVVALAFGEVEGRTVLIAGSDRTIRLWDAVTGEPVGKPMEDATGEALRSLAFTVLDGRPCVLAGLASTTYHNHGSLSVWDLATCTRYGAAMMFPTAVWSVSVPSEDSVAVGYGQEVAVLRRR